LSPGGKFWRRAAPRGIKEDGVMAETEPVRNDLLEKIAQIGPCDVLIGIPSYNNAGTIGHVVESVRFGLNKYFGQAKAVLVNPDGGSMDGTPRIVAEAAVDLNCIQATHRVSPRDKMTAPYHRLPGKGNALRMILEVAAALNVKTCAIVGGDLQKIEPDWIDRLLSPVRNGAYDVVSPYYIRHKYDGTITSLIVYPIIRALYGKRIRQPIGSELALSGGQIGPLLDLKGWDTDPVQYGADIRVTTTAVVRGARLCEALLGDGTRIHKDTGTDLSTMLTQVVGSLFTLMEENDAYWKGIRGSEPIPLLGTAPELESRAIRVNLDRMLHAFHLGVTEFRSLWNGVLSGETLESLSSVDRTAASAFHFPDPLWVRIVYDFAVALRRKTMNPEHLLRSLTPLYLGKTASFILETRETDREGVEEKIERLCLVFEREKPYLVGRWEGPAPPA
jgi:glucosylglycerate synthase